MPPLDRYPKEIALKDGAQVSLRPMVPEDAGLLWEFLQRIPHEEKMYFREDVSDRDEVNRWAAAIDYASALPILAVFEGRVVGNATLHRNRTGWKQRVGTVRILIDPEFRHRGLGTAMIRELRHLGDKASLRYLLAEMTEEQQAAVRAFEKLGFERIAVLRKYVNDQKGNMHNLVVLLHSMSDEDDETFY
ncbi:MAG: GNAT family N-acetyltransferase [Deltaproteobacteria bacterium]|nr:GNAT family N-acetyltransferase [Deltaproteobacteria bacterium]